MTAIHMLDSMNGSASNASSCWIWIEARAPYARVAHDGGLDPIRARRASEGPSDRIGPSLARRARIRRMQGKRKALYRIGESIFTLLFAMVGAVIARYLYATRKKNDPDERPQGSVA
jgi:hypothetical protein